MVQTMEPILIRDVEALTEAVGDWLVKVVCPEFV